MPSYFLYFLYVLFFIYLLVHDGAALQANNNGVLNISLESFDPVKDEAQVFNYSTVLNSMDSLEVIVTNVNSSLIYYFMIQIHSFQTNTILAYNSKFSLSASVSGTNVGLVQLVNTSSDYSFFVKNENQLINNTILVVIVAYSDIVPIPGGCNMEFMVETAPYQQLIFTNDIITVDAQSSSFAAFGCEDFILHYRMFHMYLPERDYNLETYFNELRKMITVENILDYGTEVYKPIPNQLLRRFYSAYHGTGSIYVIVVSFGDKQAAYVPISTYSCDVLNWPDSCDVPNTNFSRLLCGCIFFLGLFTCFFGHKFFKTEMFLIGSLLGGYLSFIGLSSLQLLSDTYTLIAAVTIGVIVGLGWLIFWWFCGIPVLSILLVITVLGFMIASIAFYAGLGDINIFESDLNFWGFFSSIVLMCITLLIGLTYKANILACSILGAYAVVIPIDHYIGSNMKYIFINIIRRATVDNFKMAIVDPPFQFKDAILTMVWLALAVSGVVYQWIQQRGRPPFPPSPFHADRIQHLSERTPLLVHQQYVTSQPNNLAQNRP